MRLTQLFVRRPSLVVVVCALVALAGTISMATLVKQKFPNIDFPSVFVSCYPGASPTEIRDAIVRPIEDAIAGAPNLDHMNSSIQNGQASIAATFTLDSNQTTDLVEVQRRVESTRSVLPSDLSPPSIRTFDPGQPTVVTLSLHRERCRAPRSPRSSTTTSSPSSSRSPASRTSTRTARSRRRSRSTSIRRRSRVRIRHRRRRGGHLEQQRARAGRHRVRARSRDGDRRARRRHRRRVGRQASLIRRIGRLDRRGVAHRSAGRNGFARRRPGRAGRRRVGGNVVGAGRNELAASIAQSASTSTLNPWSVSQRTVASATSRASATRPKRSAPIRTSAERRHHAQRAEDDRRERGRGRRERR